MRPRTQVRRWAPILEAGAKSLELESTRHPRGGYTLQRGHQAEGGKPRRAEPNASQGQNLGGFGPGAKGLPGGGSFGSARWHPHGSPVSPAQGAHHSCAPTTPPQPSCTLISGVARAMGCGAPEGHPAGRPGGTLWGAQRAPSDQATPFGCLSGFPTVSVISIHTHTHTRTRTHTHTHTHTVGRPGGTLWGARRAPSG